MIHTTTAHDAIRQALRMQPSYPYGWNTYNGFAMRVIECASEAGASDDELNHVAEILEVARGTGSSIAHRIEYAKKLARHATIDPRER